MMYMKTTIASLLLLVTAIQGNAENTSAQTEDALGIIHHGKETMESLQGNGRVTLEGTTVQKLLKVNGSLYTHKATIGELHVGGHAHIISSKVRGKCNISGYCHAEKSRFYDDIIFTGQKLTIQNSQAGAICVKKTHVPFALQVVELSKKSKCKGPIVFESGKGRVVIFDKSKLLGKVRGGKIEVENRKKYCF